MSHLIREGKESMSTNTSSEKRTLADGSSIAIPCVFSTTDGVDVVGCENISSYNNNKDDNMVLSTNVSRTRERGEQMSRCEHTQATDA